MSKNGSTSAYIASLLEELNKKKASSASRPAASFVAEAAWQKYSEGAVDDRFPPATDYLNISLFEDVKKPPSKVVAGRGAILL